MWNYKNGFTLIELLIVVLVIVILASVAVPSYQQFQCKEREEYRNAHLEVCAKVIEELQKEDITIKEDIPPVEENTPSPKPKPKPKNPLNDNKLGYIPRDITVVIKQEMQAELADACELEGQYVFAVGKTEYTVKCNKPIKKRL